MSRIDSGNVGITAVWSDAAARQAADRFFAWVKSQRDALFGAPGGNGAGGGGPSNAPPGGAAAAGTQVAQQFQRAIAAATTALQGLTAAATAAARVLGGAGAAGAGPPAPGGGVAVPAPGPAPAPTPGGGGGQGGGGFLKGFGINWGTATAGYFALRNVNNVIDEWWAQQRIDTISARQGTAAGLQADQSYLGSVGPVRRLGAWALSKLPIVGSGGRLDWFNSIGEQEDANLHGQSAILRANALAQRRDVFAGAGIEAQSILRGAAVGATADPFARRRGANEANYADWQGERQTGAFQRRTAANEAGISWPERERRRIEAETFAGETERLDPAKRAARDTLNARINLEDRANMDRMKADLQASTLRAQDKPLAAGILSDTAGATEEARIAGPERAGLILQTQRQELAGQLKRIERESYAEEFRPGLAAYGVTEQGRETTADVAAAIKEQTAKLDELLTELRGGKRP